MKTKIMKIVSVATLIFCVLSLCSCGNNSQSNPENIADKNAKGIVGTWIVEKVEKNEVETMSDFGASAATNLFFGENTEVQFLSNGTFTSGMYNLKYEMVDNQFIFTYKEQTYAYDCEINGDTMLFSTPNLLSITLKKQ